MLTQQVAAIAIRFFSIWLLIQIILSLPSLAMLFSSFEQYHQQDIPLAFYFGIVGSFIFIGVMAVYFLNKVASSILTRAKSTSETTLSDDSQKVLFQLAGLYFVVNALAYLPRSISFIPYTVEITLPDLLGSAGLVFQLAIGLWLISCSAFWLGLFKRLRGRA